MSTAWVVFQRSMRYTVSNPAWVVTGLLQPVLYLVLFGPLLSGLNDVQGYGGGNSWRFFVPGLLVQQCVFAAVFVGFGVLAEARSGVLDRMRVSGASQLGLLLGRISRDVLVVLGQAAVLVLGAVAFGLRAPAGGILLTFVLLAVFAVAMSALSYALALRVRSEGAYGQVVNAFTLPSLLLSGVLLPLTLAPAWLAAVARVNPLSHVVDAARGLFAGQTTGRPVLVGSSVALTAAVLALWFGVRSVRGISK
ncbi:ABC transporter permease [Micromonospora mangrovi]|uniref:Transport permease protein n=2 Tax=Micromonospora TaxID=1873 RepID=A0AAU7MBZ8_9ACTN